MNEYFSQPLDPKEKSKFQVSRNSCSTPLQAVATDHFSAGDNTGKPDADEIRVLAHIVSHCNANPLIHKERWSADDGDTSFYFPSHSRHYRPTTPGLKCRYHFSHVVCMLIPLVYLHEAAWTPRLPPVPLNITTSPCLWPATSTPSPHGPLGLNMTPSLHTCGGISLRYKRNTHCVLDIVLASGAGKVNTAAVGRGLRARRGVHSHPLTQYRTPSLNAPLFLILPEPTSRPCPMIFQDYSNCH